MRSYTVKAILAVLAASALIACSACQNAGSSNSTPAQDSVASSAGESASASDNTNTETDESSEEEQSSKDAKNTSSDPTDEKEQGDIPALKDDDGKDVGGFYNDSGILIYNRAAYEMFYGNESLAKDYADAMSKIKNALGDSVKVYNVLVPTHCGITLPERFYDEYGISNQKEYIDTIISNYTADIIGVNTFDTIAHHRDEYLYFNTDHHWTGLGAYYAYKDFCKAAGVDYLKLSDLEEGTIDGYYGSLSYYIDESLIDPDTVHYYTMDADTVTTLYDENASDPQSTRLFHTYAEGSNAYGVFLGGDNALMVCKNHDGNGKKIAVVKESYGNAFCPFIALTYSETHMMDFRYLEFDFVQYLKDHEIDEVIFINNAMASATGPRVDELNALIS